MDLILWRHADAENGIPDDARKLTDKGEKQARRVARWLAQHLPDDTRILVSPAKRAQQTAKALTKDFETCAEVGTATVPTALLKAVGWPDGEGSVLVVGHQPVIGHTLSLLLTGEARGWSVKKGAIWWLASRGRDEVVVRAVMGPDLV